MDRRRLIVWATVWVSVDAFAAGFALEHQSVSNMAFAFAGGAAYAEDASTIYWNPAGLTRISGRQAVLGLNAIYGSARFADQGTTSPAGPAFPITGGPSGNPVGWNWVPNLYYATEIGAAFNAGIGINAPFGLKTKYSSDWMGRYHAIDSELKSLNINPSLAWKPREGVSLGAGLNIQYFDATLSNAIDYGSACFAAIGAATCAAVDITPQSRDGNAKVSGDSWGVGWNVGALFELSRSTRLGIAYRSSIKHEIKGRATFQNPDLPGAFAALTAGAQDTGARSTVKTPDTISLSLYSELGSRWSILGDVTWSGWSKFRELRVRFDNGAPDAVMPENWRDTIRVSVGGGYKLDDRWTLRAGVAYENSAIPDEFRTPRIPDNAHTLIGLGANYKLSKAGSLDFGYMHAFVRDATVNRIAPGAGSLVGTYKVNADVLGVQYNHSF